MGELAVAPRYELLGELAAGGMATVHLARLQGAGGFNRLVAVKVPHAALAREPQFREMFLDEARMVSGIRHVNVVATLDVLEQDGQLLLVMEYLDGRPLVSILRQNAQRGALIPVAVAVAIGLDMLQGLRAAHEARTQEGVPLHIVHRDISPANVMVGKDGITRILDFGVARAEQRSIDRTGPGEVKGKAAYMAPEQARGGVIDGRVDLYAVGIVLWEMLTGTRLFAAETMVATMLRQLQMSPSAPSSIRPDVSSALDAVVLKALAKDADDRFEDAQAMFAALESAHPRASQAEVARWMANGSSEFFRGQERLVAESLARVSLASTEPYVVAAPGQTDPVDGEEVATQILGLEPSTPTPRTTSGSRARKRVVVATGSAIAVAAALFGASRRHIGEAPRIDQPVIALPDQRPPAQQASASELETPPLPQVSGVPSSTANAVAPVRPKRRPPSEAAMAPSTAAAPAQLPPCCAGAIQIRFDSCQNNCAAK